MWFRNTMPIIITSHWFHVLEPGINKLTLKTVTSLSLSVKNIVKLWWSRSRYFWTTDNWKRVEWRINLNLRCGCETRNNLLLVMSSQRKFDFDVWMLVPYHESRFTLLHKFINILRARQLCQQPRQLSGTEISLINLIIDGSTWRKQKDPRQSVHCDVKLSNMLSWDEFDNTKLFRSKQKQFRLDLRSDTFGRQMRIHNWGDIINHDGRWLWARNQLKISDKDNSI